MTFSLPLVLARRLTEIARVRHVLLCSDYDGTLAPIAPHPDQAELLPGAADLLHKLAQLPDTKVAIISGRSRDNLQCHSKLLDPVVLIGSHGAELPGQACKSSAADSSHQLDSIAKALSVICAATPGAWLERKPLGMAVHVREASSADAERAVSEVRSRLSGWPDLRVTEGKSVIELSISRTGKGDAVRWLRNGWGISPAVLYLGDDVTDEDAFLALDGLDVGIKVGAGPTSAAFRIATERTALAVLDFVWRCRRAATEWHDPLRDDGWSLE